MIGPPARHWPVTMQCGFQQLMSTVCLAPTQTLHSPQVMNLALPVPDAQPTTVGSLLDVYHAAGANASWMPAANATQLGGLGESYNYAEWDGGQYQFVSCDLPRRAPEYIGTCAPQTVACSTSLVDGVPYSCKLLVDNTTVAGNLSSSAYREGCEVPCDLQLDCAALCDCGDSGCGDGQVRQMAATVQALHMMQPPPGVRQLVAYSGQLWKAV